MIAVSDYPRLDAAARLLRVKRALDAGDLIGLIEASGLPLALAETMDVMEVMDAVSVRVADLTKILHGDSDV